MATAKASAGKKVIRRRRERKNIERGQVHIRSSFNNTRKHSAYECFLLTHAFTA